MRPLASQIGCVYDPQTPLYALDKHRGRMTITARPGLY
jgi:hypothetical protein